uniref:Ovule protein n=1 Tax=Heterorhabditis bacteriophora TaxID=37862 RepID=A0A1I7XEX6_HETBA
MSCPICKHQMQVVEVNSAMDQKLQDLFKQMLAKSLMGHLKKQVTYIYIYIYIYIYTDEASVASFSFSQGFETTESIPSTKLSFLHTSVSDADLNTSIASSVVSRPVLASPQSSVTSFLSEMASPRTRRVLKDLRPISNNNISVEAEGREWCASTSSARNYTPMVAKGGSGRSRENQSALGSYYGGNTTVYSDGGYNTNYGCNDGRYQGFGSIIEQTNQQDDLLTGAMSSLSMASFCIFLYGWDMLSKGASQAAAIAKDVGTQATQKATKLTGTMSQSGGILSGVATKASEIGQKSWGGISQFVKSSSLHGIGNIFPKTGYEDMASPTDTSRSITNIDCVGGNMEWGAHGLDEEFPACRNSPPVKDDYVKRNIAIEKNILRSDNEAPSLIDLSSPTNDESSTIAQFEASVSKPRVQVKQNTAKKKDWDDDAWEILNQ